METLFYNQTVDHFNHRPESYATFKQKYVINSKYWGGAKESAPIFVYFGDEQPLDDQLGAVGFLTENAPHFKALQVYIEHRFYGQSIPFGTTDEAMSNDNTRGYFNSAQTLADYAEVIIYLKKKLSADNSPVIVVGGSYGGMLASWFRLKYPHVALGALASSAPILYFDDITPRDAYYSVVTKDFKEVSKSFYETIRKSWSEIDRVASKPNGLSVLSKKFRSCAPLDNSGDFKGVLELIYAIAAQYDSPPSYPVSQVCERINGANEGTDILGRIFAGFVAVAGNMTCYPFKEYYTTSKLDGWTWQDIKLVLRRFASNIIFSNGLRDPYSSGGVLENLSDTLLAIQTAKGSHCLDILTAAKTDPQWLIDQRKVEVKIIEGWFETYYADLHSLSH
ncbi:hypothetical protein RHMOL_Rhmol12G0196800 [Rhododendron molle]|uniref:Uncharacterized protein n=1 Tax=Rhododendron molle TaxID=49168 RepID=A0ACC0LL02_RHOML|nr:hypothetical protein RHMOL_Rhmol12G0196800 [Rhododendron molle]